MLNSVEYLNIFAGKRVFVTGHTGFKGSWLAFILNRCGAEVAGYALPPAHLNSHFELLSLKNSITHFEGDIRDYEFLKDCISDFQPEFVFHLAAQALVKESYDDPRATFDTNIIGSVNLLDCIKNCKSVRSLIYVTSDKCYENNEWVWGYRENDLLGGSDPYSASKAAAELVFSSYCKSYFNERLTLGAATVRAGNVIGGGDWSKNRIIPDCIRSIQAGTPIYLRSPNSTRPWQHVLEPLSGYLLLASKLYLEPEKWSGAWNFGPSSTEVRTVKNVAESIINYLGKGAVDISGSQGIFHEARLLQLNCDKASQLLSWRPTWGVDKTIKETALWYMAYLNGHNPAEVTISQIQDFFGELK